jgi:septation ring formation regulator EzrA
MNLTKKEKDTANLLKIKFSEVRSEIENVQSEMEWLNTKAGSLIKELESLREQESNFIDSLQEKYGEGKLDPFKLIYTK